MPTHLGTRTKRVAIVDAYSTGSLLPAVLDRYGIECVHVRTPHPDVLLSSEPEGFIDDVRHCGDIAATAAVLRNHGVSNVIAGQEAGVELADQLSAELGTPGNGMSRPTVRRNKYDMAMALRDAGLAHAASLTSTDADEIVEWVESSVGYPVILKPVASSSTDNVVACTSPEQIRAVHARIMNSIDRHGMANTTVLAQEFLDGDEYFVNTVSRGGRHHTVEICRYYKLRIPGGHIIHDYNESLAPGDPVARELEAYTHQVLDALEVHNAAGHAEVMLTARGPVLVESAARMGGGQVLDINTRCYGTNQVERLALSVADPDAFDLLPTTAYQLLEHHRFVHLINPWDHGVIPSHEAMAAIRALPSHVFTVMRHAEGQSVARTIDIATQPGFVFLISDDPAQIEADYRKLREIERGYLYDGGPSGEPVPEVALAGSSSA